MFWAWSNLHLKKSSIRRVENFWIRARTGAGVARGNCGQSLGSKNGWCSLGKWRYRERNIYTKVLRVQIVIFSRYIINTFINISPNTICITYSEGARKVPVLLFVSWEIVVALLMERGSSPAFTGGLRLGLKVFGHRCISDIQVKNSNGNRLSGQRALWLVGTKIWMV